MNRRQRVCLLASAVVLGPLALPVPAQNRHTVYRVPVTGVIELGLAPYIERSVSEAAAAGASAIVLDIDTPGGRVDAAERIADALSDSEVPVYSLVNRRAFSAGALIALSTSRIYMRPGSVIGAATPVDGSGKKAPEKIVSAMRSEMRALAEAQGLDPTVAAAMVDEDVEIEGVVESGKLLTLTTSEAVALDYAVEIEDLDALLAALGYSGADVVTSKVNWAEQLVRFFSNPIVAPFLLSLGFLGLLAEIKTPSFGMAGLEDMLIFGAGVVLLGVEALVIPGFGLFGVAGIVAVAAGLFMSMLGSLPTASEYTSAGMILTTTVLLVLVSAWALIRTLPRTSRLAKSGIFLLQRTDRAIGYESAEVRDDLMDSVGTAITDLRPSGTALFGDERIDVISESEWITEGTQVRVISAEGYRHIVRAVSADEAENV